MHAKCPDGETRTSEDPFLEREDEAMRAAVPQQRLSECTGYCAGVCSNWQKPFSVSWAALLPPQLLCALQCCRAVGQLQPLGSQAEHRHSLCERERDNPGLGISPEGTLLKEFSCHRGLVVMACPNTLQYWIENEYEINNLLKSVSLSIIVRIYRKEGSRI